MDHQVTLTFEVKTPRWAPLYLGAIRFFHDLGVLDVNVDVVAAFILRRVKYRVGRGKWQTLATSPPTSHKP